MNERTFVIAKETGTYSDVLITYGVAELIDFIFSTTKPTGSTWRIHIKDAGDRYIVELSEPLPDDWESKISSALSPTKKIITGRDNQIDNSINVDEIWDTLRKASSTPSNTMEQGGEDTQAVADALELPRGWQVAIFVGDRRMQARTTYNRIVAVWDDARAAGKLGELVKALLAPYAQSASLPGSTWPTLAKKIGAQKLETASQLLNPHQGKGVNYPKASNIQPHNVKQPWPQEFLKVLGLWSCVAPRRTADTNDWKVYVLAPLSLQLHAHRDVFDRFTRYLWNTERAPTSLRADITSLLLFSRAWLDYVQDAQETTDDFEFLAAPERVVAGFHVAQFTMLSSNAYTLINLSFLSQPAWSGAAATRAHLAEIKAVIDEHLRVVRSLDEQRSDAFNLLKSYREFLCRSDWNAFFDFTTGYGHEIIRKLQLGQRYVPMFTTTNLGRLIMNTSKNLSPIVENTGFRNIAYAIRHSTVIPQFRKANKQETLYEVRYGLGAELRRKSMVTNEFIVAISDFVTSYNHENVQKLENEGRQMRRDVRTQDIEELVRLVDTYGSEVVANLLVAYGYAREPHETETQEQSNDK